MAFWKTWHQFEVMHGNADTFREMLRVKRSVAATYNTTVCITAKLRRNGTRIAIAIAIVVPSLLETMLAY